MAGIQAIPLLLAEQEVELKRGYPLGIYTLLEEIGRGGEAVVWSGFDNVRKRVVAIKFISTSLNDPVEASLVPANFEREVHLVASLAHPHILPMIEFGMAEAFSYFVMQYHCAGTLTDWLKGGPLSLVDIAHVVKQVLSALHYLHGRGIVHRDIKPSNILLDSQMRTYLADFGLAKKLSQSTMLLHTGRGTGPYASYEQQANLSILAQSDIYSLGIVIYEMLTGHLPWEGQYQLASRQKHNHDTLPDPAEDNSNCPWELTAVLRRFTSFQWQDRPQSAEVAYALFYSALPPEVQRAVGKELRGVALMQEKFLAQDACYLFERHRANSTEDERFPANLTHLAFMEGYYGRLREPLDNDVQKFLLRGALSHDYKLAEWWKKSSPAMRWEVGTAALGAEDDDVVARVLALLLREPAEDLTTAVSAKAGLEKLVTLATQSREWGLRRDALNALAHLLPPAAGWQTVGISAEADARLARLALEESTQARQAVDIIGLMQSETAVRTLLEAHDAGRVKQGLVILQQIQEAVGSLPRLVPPGIRTKLRWRQLQAQLLDDRQGVPLARALLGLLAGVVVSLLLVFGFFSQPALQMQDILLAPYPVSDIVTIVEVDDASLAQYGRWDQWPRSLHVELINQLHQAGVKTVVFDFVFEAETRDDPQLAAAMSDAGNVLQPVLVQGDALHDLSGMLRYESRILPQPALLNASAAVGHTSILHDEDGLIRRVPTLVSIDGEQYQSLAMAALDNYLGGGESALPAADQGGLMIAGRQVPVEEDGELRIFYAGPPAESEQTTFNMVSYLDVLAGTVPEELLRDKIVLVGITATAEPDRYLTPVSDGRPMYGVEILANVIESIWSGRFIRTPGTAVRLAILLGLGVLVGLVCVRPTTGLVLTLGIVVIYFLITSRLFDITGVMLDLYFPFLTMAFSYLFVTVYRYSVEVRRRREIVSLFASSVTPAVAKATLEAVRQGKINLEGQEQEVTVLLIEMRGQTDYAARHDPMDVLAMMTLFREKAVKTVLDFEGTIIHAEQGQTTAVFNAPLNQEDHAWRAVQAAQALQTEIEAYHQSVAEDHPHRDITFAFVVNTGRAVVGYAGAAGGAAFTVLGDSVDLAAQMIVAARSGQILLGEASFEQTAEQVTAVAIKSVRSKDKAEILPVYALTQQDFDEEKWETYKLGA